MNLKNTYDCDTSPYWCSDDDYQNSRKSFGRFIDNGNAYEILDRNTPRPWLNYFCNDRFVSVFSNTAMGFTAYRTTLLRITRYEHPIDYLPREFKDGREVIITDRETGREYTVFRDAEELVCQHRAGYSTVAATVDGIQIQMTVFVPVEDSGEVWNVVVRNQGDTQRDLSIRFQQKWAFALFGAHTAEGGIPYVSTPGKDLSVEVRPEGLFAASENAQLPMSLYGTFLSPQAEGAVCPDETVRGKDGAERVFKKCVLKASAVLGAGQEKEFHLFSGVEESRALAERDYVKYSSSPAHEKELERVKEKWIGLKAAASCSLPDKEMECFLNVWLKNQLHLTFNFIRSGDVGFRDTLQDCWGHALLEPERVRERLLEAVSHITAEGVCPRQYARLGRPHDLRRYMDSGTWLAMAVDGYVKETGDVGILQEKVPSLNDARPDTVINRMFSVLDMLFENRGKHHLCLVGDGDWNDALEGISKHGHAESAWLTMALYHAQNITSSLCRHIGDTENSKKLSGRSEALKDALNTHAWDGDWFVYGFTDTGKPIGSKTNREGQIHLNAQTWAVFSGLADEGQIARINKAIDERLETKLGPMLLAPPYELEAAEVGRIARLQPGTFENGSIYQHAASFKVFSDLASGDYDRAVQTFSNLLPTHPENPDGRRTSEPYAMGNFYCGEGHPRHGQNFFTWFTGTPAWLLRAGFDEILGVKADYEGLRICPKVPSSWDSFSVNKLFRGTRYSIEFSRSKEEGEVGIWADGVKVIDNLILPTGKGEVHIKVVY